MFHFFHPNTPRTNFKEVLNSYTGSGMYYSKGNDNLDIHNVIVHMYVILEDANILSPENHVKQLFSWMNLLYCSVFGEKYFETLNGISFTKQELESMVEQYQHHWKDNPPSHRLFIFFRAFQHVFLKYQSTMLTNDFPEYLNAEKEYLLTRVEPEYCGEIINYMMNIMQDMVKRVESQIERENFFIGLSKQMELTEKKNSCNPKPKIVWEKFLGRARFIYDLNECMHKKGNGFAYCIGKKGVGKTALAKRYSKIYKSRYTNGIYFLDFSNENWQQEQGVETLMDKNNILLICDNIGYKENKTFTDTVNPETVDTNAENTDSKTQPTESQPKDDGISHTNEEISMANISSWENNRHVIFIARKIVEGGYIKRSGAILHAFSIAEVASILTSQGITYNLNELSSMMPLELVDYISKQDKNTTLIKN